MNTQYKSVSPDKSVSSAELIKARAEALTAVVGGIVAVIGLVMLIYAKQIDGQEKEEPKKEEGKTNENDCSDNKTEHRSPESGTTVVCNTPETCTELLVSESVDSVSIDSIEVSNIKANNPEIATGQRVQDLLADWYLELKNSAEEKELESITNGFYSYNSDQQHVESFNSLMIFIATTNRYDLIDSELLKNAKKYPRIDRKYDDDEVTLNTDVVHLLKLLRRDNSVENFEIFKEELISRDRVSDSLYNARDKFLQINASSLP